MLIKWLSFEELRFKSISGSILHNLLSNNEFQFRRSLQWASWGKQGWSDKHSAVGQKSGPVDQDAVAYKLLIFTARSARACGVANENLKLLNDVTEPVHKFSFAENMNSDTFLRFFCHKTYPFRIHIANLIIILIYIIIKTYALNTKYVL